MKVWISVVLVAFFAYIYDKTVLPYKFQLKHFERISQCGVSSLVTDTIPRHAYKSFEAELPQVSTQEKRIRRQTDVKTAKELYRYVEEEPFVGFPPYIAEFNTLKCEEDFGVWDQIDFVGDKDRGRMGQLYAYLFLDGNLTTIEARDGFFRSKFFERPPIADHWTEDSEFSYQRLAGVNPFKLHRIFELPSNFAITPGRIENFLDAGKKFEDELKEGKIYFEDHSMLDGVPVVNGTILPAPLILHYSSINGLKPVAIQILPQAELSPMGVFYPDEGYAWLFAKIAAQHANAIDHQVVAHLLKTHLYAEVFAIAMHRAFHFTHPLYVLLHPHFIKTLSINHEARIFLIPVVIKDCAATAVSGTVEVGKRAYLADHFENLNLKKDLMKRGVWDPNLPADKQPLLGYDYRDFGLPVYNIIEKYVRNVLRVFYKDDEAVRLDSELQDFCYETRVNGKFPGFPEKIETFDDLVDVITSIIWTCSGRHSSANFNQYEMLGWVPNMPLSVQLNEWPQSKSDITNKTIVEMLPSYFRSFLQILSVKVLSKHPWNPFLHMVHPSSWQNLEAQSIRDQYVADLYKISAEFKRINEGRSDLRKYEVLDPLTMPLSIGI